MNRLLLITITFCFLHSESFSQNNNSINEDSKDNIDQKKSKLLQSSSPEKKINQEDLPILAPKKDALSNLFKQKTISSLMFNDEELGDIKIALQFLKTGDVYDPKKTDKNSVESAVKQNQENEKSYIYLASIMHYSSKEWTVWINNIKITSENNSHKKELFIRAIDRDFAKIRWSLSLSKWKILSGKNSEEFTPEMNANGQVEIDFTLKPNQTFVLNSNRIVEGRAVANVNNKKEAKKLSQ